MSNLLIIHHSPTILLQQATECVHLAAMDAVTELVKAGLLTNADELSVILRPALTASLDDLHSASAVLVGTPANFGYLSGAVKHFFDSTFTDRGAHSDGLPFSYWIRGGHDTTGAQHAMKAITKGFGWSLAAEPVTWVGELNTARRDELTDMAQAVVGLVATTTDRV